MDIKVYNMIKEHKEFGEKLNNPDFCKRIDDTFKFHSSDKLLRLKNSLLSVNYGFCGSEVLRCYSLLERKSYDIDIVGNKLLPKSLTFKHSIYKYIVLNIINLIKLIMLTQKKWDHSRIIKCCHYQFYLGDKIDYFVKSNGYINSNAYTTEDSIKVFTASSCIKANYRLYYIMDKYKFLGKFIPRVKRKYLKGFNDCNFFIEKTKIL